MMLAHSGDYTATKTLKKVTADQQRPNRRLNKSKSSSSHIGTPQGKKDQSSLVLL